ncbi:MAG: SurA N-terminal domain-containing protein [bacterium]
MFEKTDDNRQKKSSRPPAPKRYRFAFGLSRRKQKTIMAFVAVLVTFTFVIGFHQLFMGLPGDESFGSKIGTLGGLPLTDYQLQKARAMARVHLILAMNETDDSPDFDRNVRKTAWRRLASHRYAEKLGITGTKEEAYQLELTQFTRDGVFQQDAYENFYDRRLPKLNISAADFRAYMESSLVLARLESAISAAAWLPAYDMSREVSRYTDSFLIECVNVPASALDKPVAVSAVEAREFFDNNPKYFVQPERMRVKYVVFPVSNFMASAAALPSVRALDYYENNKAEFETTTNGVTTARTFDEVKDAIMSNMITEAATNYYDKNVNLYTTTDTNDLEVIRPFAEVSEEITRTLARRDALGIAEERAAEFADTMNPGRDGALITLDRAAAATNLSVNTSQYFARYERVPGLNVSLAFNQLAFESLRPNEPYDHFSAPIVENDNVYVISFDDKRAEHVPDFNSVASIASELAWNDKTSKAVAEKAAEIHKALQAGLKSGKTFQDAAASQNLKTVSAGPFSWIFQPTNIVLSASMVRAITLCNERELTEPIPSTNGITIAYVASRVDGRTTTDPSYMQYLTETIREEKAKRTFIDWQQRLLEGEKVVAEDKELENASATNDVAIEAAPAGDSSQP